jgi:[phosphatase 2A protein]-leucine-carboxy methyltransferase
MNVLIVPMQQSRSVSLPGAEPYPDLTSLSRRFLDLGFTTAQAVTLRDIRRRFIDSRELQRLSQLEMLDEVEELELVLDHYAVSWGVKFPEGWVREGGAGAAWGLVANKQPENDEDLDDD